MAVFNRNQVIISGLVAVIRIHVTNEANDEDMYARAMESRTVLDAQISSLATEYLGNQFEVTDVRYDRGSLTVFIFITTVSAILSGMSKYKSLCDSFDKFTSQVKSLLRGRLGSSVSGNGAFGTAVVTGGWSPTDTMASAPAVLNSGHDIDASSLLLFYLVLSHAALMGLLAWLLVIHLK